jgi:hypothetical protein
MNPHYCVHAALSFSLLLPAPKFSIPSTHSLYFPFQSALEGYDPRKVKVRAKDFENWTHRPLTGKLMEVPGIGSAAIKTLAKDDRDLPKDELKGPRDKVTTTYQLLGVYLSMKGLDDTGHGPVSSYELNQRFFQWLGAKGVVCHRCAIVKAIAGKRATYFANDSESNDEEK